METYEDTLADVNKFIDSKKERMADTARAAKDHAFQGETRYADTETAEGLFQMYKDDEISTTEVASKGDSFMHAFDSAYNATESLAIAAQAGAESFAGLLDEQGFETVSNVVSQVNRMLSYRINLRGMFGGGKHDGFWIAPEAAIGNESWENWSDKSYAGKTAAIHKQRAQDIKDHYLNPYAGVDNTGTQIAGSIGGVAADPTMLGGGAAVLRSGMLLSKGKAVGSAAAVGVGYGVLDPAAQMLAQVEGVDWNDVAIGASAGFLMGGVTGYIGRGYAAKAIKKGLRANATEIQKGIDETVTYLKQVEAAKAEMAKQGFTGTMKNSSQVEAMIADFQSASAEEIAKGINQAYKLGDATEMDAFVNGIIRQANGMGEVDDITYTLLNRIEGKEGMLGRVEDSVSFKQMKPAEQKYVREQVARYTKEKDDLFSGYKAEQATALDKSIADLQARVNSQHGVSSKALAKSEKSYTAQIKKGMAEHKAQWTHNKNTELASISRQKALARKAHAEGKITAGAKKKTINMLTAKEQGIKARVMPKYRAPQAPKELAKLRDEVETLSSTRISELAAEQRDEVMGTLSKMSPEDKAALSKATGATTRPEGATTLDDALAHGMDGNATIESPVGKKQYEEVGKLSDKAKPEAPDPILSANEKVREYKHFSKAHYLITRPGEHFKKMGISGKKFHDMLYRADMNTREMVSASQSRLNKLFNDKGLSMKGSDGNIVRGVLNKTLKTTDAMVTSKHLEIAKDVRKTMNGVLQAAADVGVLTRKEVTDLIAKADTEGYFPRVYNTVLLETRKGAQKFEQALQDMKITNAEDAKAVIRHLTQSSENVVEGLLAGIKKQPDGTYRIPRQVARKMREGARSMVEAKRSHHLEQARKFPEYLEKDLNPFMIEDFGSNMNTYLEDTAKRISYSREFGANDEVLAALAKEAELEHGLSNLVPDMLESAYLAMGDPRSHYINQFMQQSSMNRKFRTGLDTLANTKLILAQILNAGQPVVNGTLRLAATGENPIVAFGKALDATLKMYGAKAGSALGNESALLYKNTAYEVADRAGAAFEAAGLRLMGDAMMNTNTVAKMTGGAGPARAWSFQGFNTAFMRYTGFADVEHTNRVIAHQLGKAHIESLIEKKTKLLGKQKINNLGKSELRKLDVINKNLSELGLDSTIDPGKYTVRNMDDSADIYSQVLNAASLEGQDISRAATKFSNDVNFVNTPLTKPMAWNSPNAKIFMKFKTFALHQQHFVYDNAIKPLMKGNTGPLLAYLAAAPAIGMSIAEIRSMLKGDDKDFTMTQRVVDGFTQAGGFGLAAEALSQSASNRNGLISFAAGPIINDAMKLGNALYDSGVTAPLGSEFWESGMDADFKPEKLTQWGVKAIGPTNLAATAAQNADMDVSEWIKAKKK